MERKCVNSKWATIYSDTEILELKRPLLRVASALTSRLNQVERDKTSTFTVIWGHHIGESYPASILWRRVIGTCGCFPWLKIIMIYQSVMKHVLSTDSGTDVQKATAITTTFPFRPYTERAAWATATHIKVSSNALVQPTKPGKVKVDHADRCRPALGNHTATSAQNYFVR